MDGLKKDAIVYLFTKAGRPLEKPFAMLRLSTIGNSGRTEGKCTNSSPTKSNTRRQIAGKRRT